jgi:hypothetical protein
MQFNISIANYDFSSAPELYAELAFNEIASIYPPSFTKIIKENAIVKGSQIIVDGFLAAALLLGKPNTEYSLKEGLLMSPRAKTASSGRKYVRVPIDSQVVTLTEDSSGWIHPGFTDQFWNYLLLKISAKDILTELELRSNKIV